MTRAERFPLRALPRSGAILACVIGVVMGPCLTAQTPPRPATGVHDETRLFTDVQKAELEAKLAQIQRRTGVSVFVTALTFSSDATARDTARRLAAAWCADIPGVVLLFDRGKAGTGLAVSPAVWRDYPADEVTALLGRTDDALSKADAGPEDRLQAAVTVALRELQNMHAARAVRQKPVTPAEMKLAKALAVVLAALLLLAALIARWSNLAQRRRTEKFFFPDVEVGTRLGAPFGGGVVASSEE